MKVFLSFDIEVWCNDWQQLDARFPGSFDRYVYGRSSRGNYALPKTLEILQRHGLLGVFFVEPLFSARFGKQYLREIVQLIASAGQDVQLHLHPEWTDEIRPKLIPDCDNKRQHLIYYSLDEQVALIGWGKQALENILGRPITAFRAGSYAANNDTFAALARNGIPFDSSLNGCMWVDGSDLRQPIAEGAPWCCGPVTTFPVAVFRDGLGRYRPAQVGACAFAEFKQALLNAQARGCEHFVIVSHNFEMLRPQRSDPDLIVARRFERLCGFLSEHRDLFQVGSFATPSGTAIWQTPTVTALATGRRYAEQLLRRLG